MNLGRRAHKINDMHEDDPLRAEMIRRMKDQVRLIVRDVIHHDKSATLFNFFFAAFQEHREVLVQRAVLFNSITTRLAETGHRDLVDRFLYLMPLRRQRMIKDEKILIWDPVKGWEDHGMYYWPQLPEFEFLSKWME